MEAAAEDWPTDCVATSLRFIRVTMAGEAARVT